MSAHITKREEKDNRFINILVPLFDTKHIAIWFLIVLFAMVPLIIAQYPMYTITDLYVQLDNYLSGIYQSLEYNNELDLYLEPIEGMSTHHPIFVTYLFGAIYSCGNMLGGTGLGLLLCVIFQALVVAFSTSGVLCYTGSLFKEHKAIVLFCTIFCLILPGFFGQGLCIGKDALFACAFVWFFIAIADYAMKDKSILSNRMRIIVAIISAIFLCLFRNNGVIIVSIVSIVLSIIRHDLIKQSACIVLIGAILPTITIIGAAKICGWNSSDTWKESLGVCYYQTAAYTSKHSDTQTEEEKAIIDSVLDYSLLSQCCQDNFADKAKGTFKHDSNIQQRLAYLGLWLRNGVSDPICYIEAILNINESYFGLSDLPVRNGVLAFDIDDPSVIAGYMSYTGFSEEEAKSVFSEITENNQQNLPSEYISVTEYEFAKEILDAGGEIVSYPGYKWEHSSAHKTIYEQFDNLSLQPEWIKDLCIKLNLYYMAWNEIPIINLFAQSSFYSLWLVLLFIICTCTGTWKGHRALMAPIIVFMCQMIIYPIADARYIAPIIFLSPFLLSFILSTVIENANKLEIKRQEEKDKNSQKASGEYSE